MRQAESDIGAAELLEAFGTPAAVLGRGGEVQLSNGAWERDGIAAADLPDEVREVLQGRRRHYEAEVPRPGEHHDRWMLVHATGVAGGALVVLRDITARRMLEATLRGLGGHEGQTGLLDGGRTVEVLTARLTTARQVGRPVSLLQIEVDGLDRVRGDLGDPVAAELMVELVARVRRATRDGDLISRISEERMLLVCTGLGEVGLHGLADRLVGLLEQPCRVGGRSIVVETLVGRTVVPPASTAMGALDALDRDTQRRRGPRSGQPLEAVGPVPPPRSDAPEPTPPVDGTAPTGVVTYAPILSASSGLLVGAELVGTVEPAATAAAAAGLLAAWRSLAPESSPMVLIPLATGWEADAETAIHGVWESIGDAHLDPTAVVLCVEAGALGHQLATSAAPLARLRARGVRVLLDDVGSMNVPIGQIVGSPLDLVRIDLGNGPAAAPLSVRTAVLRALVGAAAPLGLEVLVSGIDLDIDRRGLASLGVRLLQGVADGRCSAADVLALVAASRSDLGDLAPATIEPVSDGAAGADLDATFRAMAHEVRTPLTVAMGYASMLERSPDPDAASASTHIRRAAERIEQLLRNVEEVRLIDVGDLRLVLHEVDAVTLVEGIVDEHRALLGVPVQLPSARPHRAMVAVDELRIVQVLVNLLSNAAKFSPPGSPVDVCVVEREGWVHLEVADRGPGIPASQLARAFAKYGRTDRTRPGSGLGLYLAQGIAGAHGGDISYRRRAGGGSVFSLVLPGVAPSA